MSYHHQSREDNSPADTRRRFDLVPITEPVIRMPQHQAHLFMWWGLWIKNRLEVPSIMLIRHPACEKLLKLICAVLSIRLKLSFDGLRCSFFVFHSVMLVSLKRSVCRSKLVPGWVSRTYGLGEVDSVGEWLAEGKARDSRGKARQVFRLRMLTRVLSETSQWEQRSRRSCWCSWPACESRYALMACSSVGMFQRLLRGAAAS